MILVTGATGHIGNVLVRELLLRYPEETIRVLLMPGEKLDMFHGLTLDLFYGDIRNQADVHQMVSGARLVFHLAGLVDIAPRHPGLLEQVNVGGTANIVSACLASGVQRLVYVSSVHALPDLPDDQPIVEIKDFPVPDLLGPYAQTKSAATALVYEGIAQGLDAVVVFPTGIIGPFDYRSSPMGRLFRYLSTQGWLKLVMSFKGAYNFVDVRDVVNGLLAAAEKGRSGEGYILSGHRMTMRETIRLVRQALNQRQPRIFLAPTWLVRAAAWLTGGFCRLLRIKPVFTPYSVAVLFSNANASCEKAARELGYQPRPLIETLRDTMDWMKEVGWVKKPKN